MRQAYRVLGFLIALAVVVQASAIAFGTFGFINEIDRGTVFTPSSDAPNFGPMLHAINGSLVIPGLSVALLVVSFFAKVRRGVRLALLTLLAVFIQINLGFFSFDTPAIGLLHGVNAFAVLGLALLAARAASDARVPAAPAVEEAIV
ncbi:MAG TPA: hypothetical protein VFR23_03105 [Jiangellaceae bacterium]|nr:hypothetical protein [Jiangellaceae bacterium]